MDPRAQERDVRWERVAEFYRALLRFRRAVLFGWALVTGGAAGLLFRWSTRSAAGLADILLAVLAIAAGLVLVSHSLEFLSVYARTLFRETESGVQGTGVEHELDQVAREVEGGGWQEAFSAVARLRGIAERHGLPPPD